MSNGMKKVAINDCFGGFGLSPKATKRLAELRGRECYFYESSYGEGTHEYIPLTDEQAFNDKHRFLIMAFDVPNAHEINDNSLDKHSLYESDIERHDPLLIQVIEELGKEANGSHSKLTIVEIPEDVNYEIEEYDGMEHIAEIHRTWS